MIRPAVGSCPTSSSIARASRGQGLLPSAFARVAIMGFSVLAGASVVDRAAAQVTVQTIIGRAVTDDTHTAEVNNAIARFRERDFDGAKAVLERIHAEDPKVPPPGVMLATLWLAANQVPAARRDLDLTVAKYPDDPEAYLILADLDFQERRVTEAALLFERATELTGKFDSNAKRKRDFLIRCEAGAAAVCEARGEWEKGLAHIERWVEIDPDSAGARQRLGNTLFQLDRPDEALGAFQEARKIDPSIRQPEMLLASLYDQAKKPDQARELVSAAVKAAGDDASVRIAAANWYLLHGDIAAARENATAAIGIDDKSLDARLVNGTIARVERDFPAATKFFEEAHSQSPRNYPASESLALVLAESEDRDDVQRALEIAETNFAMVKDNAQLQIPAATTMAWVYYKLGRMADAEKILAQVAQNNALNADGAYYIARILSDKGEKDQARRLLEQVIANETMFANRGAAEELLESLRGTGVSIDGN